MTLTLDLPENLLARLREQAEASNISVESFVVLKLQDLINNDSNTSTALADKDFESLSDGIIVDYREVLQRLA